eukprot:253191-Pleurochrysis_carterae.AAC.1
MSVVGIYRYAESREGVATPARPCASDGSSPRAGSLPLPSKAWGYLTPGAGEGSQLPTGVGNI